MTVPELAFVRWGWRAIMEGKWGMSGFDQDENDDHNSIDDDHAWILPHIWMQNSLQSFQFISHGDMCGTIATLKNRSQSTIVRFIVRRRWGQVSPGVSPTKKEWPNVVLCSAVNRWVIDDHPRDLNNDSDERWGVPKRLWQCFKEGETWPFMGRCSSVVSELWTFAVLPFKEHCKCRRAC
jgi:hypothetical protein